MADQALSYVHGTADVPLLGDTIGALLDRFEAIELAEGPGFEALHTAMFYGPKRLPLRLHPA